MIRLINTTCRPRIPRLAIALLALFVLLCQHATAGSLDDIRQALQAASVSQVQEKVYIHTDNKCYFVGDTLWYKAYVVRADNLQPTNMSRILYVELLSPDGLLVERQNIIVSSSGYTCGQFALQDSLYSGYYELRAYTRWMLNFNVRHHRYRFDETWAFYNKQMAADYYRIWDGLYSRVLPVYSKPEKAGDYDTRYMYQRPKTRAPQRKKDDLVVTFYPEGGHLVEGVPCRVAFSVTDQHGEAVDIKGSVTANGMAPISIATEHMGRGSFIVTPPAGKRLTAKFNWHGKQWEEKLPKAEEQGATLCLDGDGSQLTISANGLPKDHQYAVSILCRGVLKAFIPVSEESSGEQHTNVTLSLPLDSLPTGVNDVTLFDDEGRIWADRLFFVNHHENDQALITTDADPKHTYQPYEHVSMDVQLEGVDQPTNFSVAIYDTYTDEVTYDDNNLMTSLLLSSELRGFIAYPAYYFERDDAIHRRHLDLLMMVQGWRKYNWQELAEGERPMRYEPEKTMTVEGAVYKSLGIYDVQPEEISQWPYGVGVVNNKTLEEQQGIADLAEQTDVSDLTDQTAQAAAVIPDDNPFEMGNIGSANDHLGINHGNLRHEVLVEAEVSVPGQVAGSTQRTQDGRFIFEIPPFYGTAYLNMKAYSEKDSVKKNMASRSDRKILDETSYPDYYVKRDLFYPVFTHDYTFYEKHLPQLDYGEMIDTLSDYSMENEVHQLEAVSVRGHRRGKRAVDWKKPAFVINAYDLYNDITDRGLSYGTFDARQFPIQVCRLLYGNMNRPNMYNIDGRMEGHTYYRNYSPYPPGASEAQQAGLFVANRTPQWYMERLRLRRLQDIRVFSDYEPRTEDSTMVESHYAPDATVELVLIPDDGRQPTFRDRHLVLHGFNMAEQFYQPDYSQRQPNELPADYRRTLYWNPNAVSDEQGHFTATFYNNGKQTRISMSAAGIAHDGRLLHSITRKTTP